MKKLLLLLFFCLPSQGQASDEAVDIAFMMRSGVSLSTLNIFLLDVDKPDAEAIQWTHQTDIGTCYEESDGSDVAFAACDAIQYPPYLGLWQIQRDDNYFYFENLETGESQRLYYCEPDSIHCNYSLSSDGRWLVFNSDEGLMLADLAQFGAADLIPIIDGETHTSIFFWLNEQLLVYWHNSLEHYYIYDLATDLTYPLERVLNRETLAIELNVHEGWESLPLPEASAIDESALPLNIRRLDTRLWRPDGTGLIYASSDYEILPPLYCENCAVAYWDRETQESQLLFGLEGEKIELDEGNYTGGMFLVTLHWSLDSSRFLAGFMQIGVYHRPNVFWLYDMETAELRELFYGAWAQWLR